ncbi:cyclic nucleotide-binding domain-containing protein [Aliamphritea spongicola]|nr:cyclic nucleotide-binding domain-containing protein [Aliamphritea spongicola]
MSHWHLESLNWLDRLSADDQEALRCASRVMEFAPREMVFTPNLEADAVFLLEKGLVRIFRTSSNGGEFTFGFIKPGKSSVNWLFWVIASDAALPKWLRRGWCSKCPEMSFWM